MPLTAQLGLRPISPVEEDLQRLFDEVLAGFADEETSQSSERDLETIYNGYADDSTHDSNLLSKPSQPTPRSSSPYRPPVDTANIHPASSTQSPNRRRLPPTPNSVMPIPMPEPDPYFLSPQKTYSPYQSFPSSASQQDSSSPQRRLPQEPAYANGVKTPNKTHFSPQELSASSLTSNSSPYTSHANSSYSTISTTVTLDRGKKSPVLTAPMPPSNSVAYSDDLEPRKQGHQPSYNPYDQEVDLEQPHQNQTSYFPASTAPVLPPLPPKIPYPSNSGSMSPSTPLSPQPEVHPSGSSSKKAYPEQQNVASSSKVDPHVQYDDDDDDESPSDPPPPAQLENWDEYAYLYRDRKVKLDGRDDEEPDMLRRPTDMLRTLADFDHKAADVSEPTQEDGFWEEEEDEDELRFVNVSLLSHIAMQLRDKVPRGIHVKGSIPYPNSFTGKDIVSTIQSQIQRELAINHNVSTSDRRVALQIARTLQNQLFFVDVDWGKRELQDGVDDVYTFFGEAGSESIAELPTGITTMLTRCYSASCGEGIVCYSYTCPRKGNQILTVLPPTAEVPLSPRAEEWSQSIDPVVLSTLSQADINRQTIIHKLISREEQYLQDLDLVESLFIKPLRAANPPIMPLDQLDDIIDDIFGNIMDLRETNRRLLEVLYVRQREEGPVIQRIGDLFLEAASEFRYAYPTYIGHLPVSEKRLKEELESNNAFRLFLEHCLRQQTSTSDSPRLDLKHFLNRPAEHLQKYPILLDVILKETAEENPDADFLVAANEAIRTLQCVAQLRTFQVAMGKGVPGKWEWHDLVPPELIKRLTKHEAKRQAIIFELIKGEMAYVKDLENITQIYVDPLRHAEPPILPRDRLEEFIAEVFHNYSELYEHHQRLVDKFHEIQREQHPNIKSVTAAMFDAALNWREAYMEYIPNYPIAAYRIDEEMANNLAFKTFVEQCVRHPDAHRLDMKSFINRPIPRLLRYELLLKGIMDESPPEHEDHEEIPNVIDVIKALGKETEPGVQSAKTKVEVWRYNAHLVFKAGEAVDLDLLDKSRQLIHSGKLLRQPESGLEFSGWSELHILLFDNYLVMTKHKERDGVTKYQVNRRPVPLDLLSLVNFTDPPTQRNAGLLRPFSQAPSPDTDARHVFPLTLHHNGRTGGPYILYAESSQIRAEWKNKLEEALGLRKIVQESNKVFEIEYLSRDTFIMPSLAVGAGQPWTHDNQFTGKVTCSVPFNTPDGRALVAIGCSEGVWIGFRHDPKSMRRVLLLKMVTQCAMLEEFGIFLVLADKALFAYHIEALVPTPTQATHASQAMPQKISGTKDVHFFSVGILQGRTLIVYMKKKGMDSIFRVLEPVGDKINERVKAAAGIGTRLGFRSAKSEWFRVFRDFFLPSDSFDVFFLKARVAILCAKGFEVMNLQDFGSISLPQKEDPRHTQLIKRCENARPIGMFRSTEDEFLLCYDEFGLYVDKHGDPSRSGNTIEWEGTAERVAYHHPYILLFDSRFIEIRHVTTGRLAQIIPGTDVRCTWDGRGGNSSLRSSNTPAQTPSDDVQEAQVHFVMNSTDLVTGPGGMRSKNIVQHVCELIPTVTLFPETTPTSATPSSSIPPTGNSYNAQASPSTHQYSNSYSSSLNSYGSSMNSRVQNYPPVAPQQPYSPTQSQSYQSYGVPQVSTTPYGYSSPTQTLKHHNSALAPTPQHGYGGGGGGGGQPQQQASYANAQGYPTAAPSGNVGGYFDGSTNSGYSRPSIASSASQQDLRHPQSWRS